MYSSQLNQFALVSCAIALGILVSCTDQPSVMERQSNMTMPNNNDTRTREVFNQPGIADKKQLDKGSADLELQKKTITEKTETVKERVPTVEEKNVRADINRMSAEEFTKLGLPRETAESVVRYRDEHGKFSSADDLKRVPGMNTAWLNSMRSKLGAG